MRKTIILIALFALVLALPNLSQVVHSAASSHVDATDQTTANISANGDAQVRESIAFTQNVYSQVKVVYPNSTALTRLFKPVYSSHQYENVRVSEDDAAYTVAATYTLKGFAVNHGDYWSIENQNHEGTTTIISQQTSDSITLTWNTSSSSSFSGQVTATINFPSQTSQIKYDSSTQTLTYVPPPTSTSTTTTTSNNLPLLQGAFGPIPLAAGIALIILAALVFLVGRVQKNRASGPTPTLAPLQAGPPPPTIQTQPGQYSTLVPAVSASPVPPQIVPTAQQVHPQSIPPQAISSTPPKESPPAKTRTVRFCHSCGFTVNPEDAFCHNCGQQL